MTRISADQLKSNLGDVIRATVLASSVSENFLWITDEKGKSLLKYFLEPNKIISLDKIAGGIVAEKVYNINNYFFPGIEKISGEWKIFVPDFSSQEIYTEKNTELLVPYSKIGFSSNKSYQQALIESAGFLWKGQDYPLPKIDIPKKYDIGLNWNVHADWTSKHWPKEHWDKLEKILKKEFSVSYQQGLNNLDEYINWMASCSTIITCESLGLHLASALRKRVIAIVGAADNTEYSYNRIEFLKPAERACMPCNSPKCKFESNCLSEIYPEDILKKLL